MEFPTALTPNLFFAMTVVLALMPLVTTFTVVKMGQIYRMDRGHPRNKIIKRFMISAAVICVASYFVAFVAVNNLVRFYNGTLPEPDFGSVIFMAVITTAFFQPFLNWRGLNALGQNIVQVQRIPETQDQREDREFGEERRKLEVEHNKALDKK